MKNFLRLPRPVLRPKIIHPLAFTLALVCAPLLVALFGFWLFIPVFAIAFGGPLYLALGVPALLWFIPRYGVKAWQIGILASLVNLIGVAAIALVLLQLDLGMDADDFLRLYVLVGTPVAFAWGLTFGLLYPAFERSFEHKFARAVPA
ncbi:hypothetical protein [Planktotalea sp.]|uniref:hypothetical protein n=1 Tax=Planktotalea sp. TaxID=2029877 RepID=UPI00329A3EAD